MTKPSPQYLTRKFAKRTLWQRRRSFSVPTDDQAEVWLGARGPVCRACRRNLEGFGGLMATVRQVLSRIVQVLTEEAERNPDFDVRLRAALGVKDEASKPNKVKPPAVPASGNTRTDTRKRGSNRRTPAVLDPVHLARQNEGNLRVELGRARPGTAPRHCRRIRHGPGTARYEWKTIDRIIDRIVEVSMARAEKGSAFR